MGDLQLGDGDSGGEEDGVGRGASSSRSGGVEEEKGSKDRKREDQNGGQSATARGLTPGSGGGGVNSSAKGMVWVSKLVCNTCKTSFAEVKDHRDHYRTDWHRYNLKLKEKGGEPVNEEEFSQVGRDDVDLVCDVGVSSPVPA